MNKKKKRHIQVASKGRKKSTTFRYKVPFSQSKKILYKYGKFFSVKEKWKNSRSKKCFLELNIYPGVEVAIRERESESKSTRGQRDKY